MPSTGVGSRARPTGYSSAADQRWRGHSGGLWWGVHAYIVSLLCTALIEVWHVPSTMSTCRVARMPCTGLLLVESWTWSSSCPTGLGQRYMTRMGMTGTCYTGQHKMATVMLLAMSLRTWSWILRTGPRWADWYKRRCIVVRHVSRNMWYGLVDRCICLIRNVSTSFGFQHVCTLGAD